AGAEESPPTPPPPLLPRRRRRRRRRPKHSALRPPAPPSTDRALRSRRRPMPRATRHRSTDDRGPASSSVRGGGSLSYQLNPSETSRSSDSILRPAPSARRDSRAAKSRSP